MYREWTQVAKPNSQRSALSIAGHTHTLLLNLDCALANCSIVSEDLGIPAPCLPGLQHWLPLQSSASRCRCPDFKISAKSLSKFSAMLCACLWLKPQGCKMVLANKCKGSVEGFWNNNSVSLCVFVDSEKKMENLVGLFTQTIRLAYHSMMKFHFSTELTRLWR